MELEHDQVPMTDRTTPAFAARLDRLIGVQRLAMVWEDLWPAVQRPAMTVGIAVMVVASGVLQNMNAPGRIAALAGLALLFAISLRGLFGVALPSRLAAMRRMESAAGVAHRGVSSLADAPAPELDRPETKPLWTEHKRRQFATLGHIPVSPPRSAWRKFDPAAVRVPVALGALVALILGTGDFATNLRDATRLTPTTVAVPLTLDAWLKPPAYTAKPPLLLSGDAMHEKVLGGQDILVPENSVFTARLTGAVLPTLKFLSVETASEDETTAPQEIAGISQAVSVADGVLTAEAKLTRPAMIVVADGDRELARYRLVLIPDQPPEIQLTKSPHGEARGALAIDWWAKDDYGVKALSGELTLADEQDGGIGFDSNGIFLFDPPELKLALRHPNAKDEKGTSTNDLAAHPWAGLRVVMTLKVKDAAGQEQSSPEAIFVLPQREFIRPLAQALIEQRKQLIHYPEKAAEAGALLDALLAYPAGLVDRSGHIIAIASLSSRLRNASGYDDVKLAISGLWDVAVAIEEGSLADARAELQALRKELEKALQDGAPPERIAELMDRMRQAMDRFLEAMREETERRRRDGMAGPVCPAGGARRARQAHAA